MIRAISSSGRRSSSSNAVLVDDPRDLLFGQAFEQLGGRLLVARGVHTHVERRVLAETEAPLRRVELERFERRLLSDPYTEEDEAAIARLGI